MEMGFKTLSGKISSKISALRWVIVLPPLLGLSGTWLSLVNNGLFTYVFISQ